jgi:hypothetical protein
VVELRRTSPGQIENIGNQTVSVPRADTVSGNKVAPVPQEKTPKTSAVDTSRPVTVPSIEKKNNEADTPAGIEFRVQVLSSATKIPPGSKELKGYKDLAEIRIGGQYKYMSAPIRDYQEALELRKKLAAVFPGAFVVPFRNGNRITLEEATGRLVVK